MIDGIINSPWGRLVTSLLVFVLLAGPPMLFTAAFAPHFFETTDLMKLLLVCMGGVALPFCIFGSLLYMFIAAESFCDGEDEWTPKAGWEPVMLFVIGASCAFTAVPVICAVLIGAVGWVATIRSATLIAILFFALLLAFLVAAVATQLKKAKASHQKPATTNTPSLTS